MDRDHHEVHRGSEHQQPREGHSEHRPCGMSGQEFNHNYQQMIRAEQQMFREMEDNLIKNGFLPPNPFMNGFDNGNGQQQQQEQHKDGGGILDGITKAVGVVGKVASLAALI